MPVAGDDRPSVLIVEDNEDLADLYAAHLGGAHEVDLAHSGEQALETVTSATDVVLLDRTLPGISGDEVLVAVRDRNLDVCVAMVTAAQPEIEITRLAIDDYLVKPVTGEALRAAVRRLLRIENYDSLNRQLSSLRVRRNVLRAERSGAELEQNGEFRGLEARIRELEQRLARFEAQMGNRPRCAESPTPL